MRTALGEKLKIIRDKAIANGMKLLSEDEIEMVRHDIVQVPPRRRYDIELEVPIHKKAEPNIIEPEEER